MSFAKVNRNKLSLAFILGVTIACSSGLAHAAWPDVTVRFGDLNLDDPRDAATLYVRLHQAAARVCPTSGMGRLYVVRRVIDRCMEEVIGGAVDSIHKPLLTAYTAERLESRRIAGVPPHFE